MKRLDIREEFKKELASWMELVEFRAEVKGVDYTKLEQYKTVQHCLKSLESAKNIGEVEWNTIFRIAIYVGRTIDQINNK